jgi:hypothetical protein
LGDEGFDFSRQGVVELDFGHRRSVFFPVSFLAMK